MALDKVVDSAKLDAQLTNIADTIRAKAGITEQFTFPDEFSAGVEKVYSVGKADGVFEAAPRGVASGAAVRLEDVSPLVHSIPVKVRSKNLFNIKSFDVQRVSGSAPYITEVGENYIRLTTNEGGNTSGYCSTGKKLSALCPGLQAGRQYVLNAKTDNADKKSFYFYNTKTYWKFGEPLNVTQEILDQAVVAYGLYEAGAVCTISDIQIEEGTTATAYTPYMPDLTAVTVKAQGKNLFDLDTLCESNANAAKLSDNSFSVTSHRTTTGTVPIPYLLQNSENFIGKAITISGQWEASAENKGAIWLSWTKAGASKGRIAYVPESGGSVSAVVPETPESDCVLTVYVFANSGGSVVEGDTVTYRKVQVELGGTATAYEPYTEPVTYPVNEDGTCEVELISPVMTLLTDNPNVVMNCEYAKTSESAYEEGVKSEYDRFWDTFQQDGKRTDYKNGFFGPNWTDETFKPKYDLVCTDCNSMFYNVCINDIKGILERRGIAFDTSACPNVNSMFYTTQFAKDQATSLPAVDVSNVSNINAVFYGQSQVTTIELLNVQEDAIFTRAFNGCTRLVDLTLTGTIGGAGLDLSRPTALSKTSIGDVISCLSVNTSGLSITLSKTAVEAAFTDEEWVALVNTRSNWTINLV